MNNNFNEISKLYITTKLDDNENRNYVSDVKFTAPFKITKPFYDKDDNMSIMMMSVSAGIMAGDVQDIVINVSENSRVKVFSQAFEKIHKMNDGYAKRDTVLNVNSNGFLEYNPLPTIPFANSSFENNTVINLEDKTAKLIYSEILTCGRVARDEFFEYSFYKSKTTINLGDELVYFDNANYTPSQMDMSGYCMFEGYTHQSNLIVFNFDLDAGIMSTINDIISENSNVTGGCSRTHTQDICVRLLGNNSENLININNTIIQIINQ